MRPFSAQNLSQNTRSPACPWQGNCTGQRHSETSSVLHRPGNPPPLQLLLGLVPLCCHAQLLDSLTVLPPTSSVPGMATHRAPVSPSALNERGTCCLAALELPLSQCLCSSQERDCLRVRWPWSQGDNFAQLVDRLQKIQCVFTSLLSANDQTIVTVYKVCKSLRGMPDLVRILRLRRPVQSALSTVEQRPRFRTSWSPLPAARHTHCALHPR